MIRRITVDYGTTYSTDLKVGMNLILDPRLFESNERRRQFSQLLEDKFAEAVAQFESEIIGGLR